MMTKATEFKLFDGKLPLLQPESGFRTSMDAVFLAACVPEALFAEKQILDLGCGIGTIGFCLLSRFSCHITGYDIQPEMIALAEENARRNNFTDKTRFVLRDLREKTKTETAEYYDAVISNPPYMEDGRGTPSAAANRNISHYETMPFAAWARVAALHLKRGGYFFFVHRADRLDGLLGDLRSAGFGSFTVLPMYTLAERPAKRVIIAARKDKAAPLVLRPGLVIQDGDAYTETARRVLYETAAFDFFPDEYKKQEQTKP